MFGFGTYEEAILHSQHAPVYHYLFTFEGEYSFATSELGLNYTGEKLLGQINSIMFRNYVFYTEVLFP